MDFLEFIFYGLMILLLLVILGITYIHFTSPYSMFKDAGIPGPEPKWFIGTMAGSRMEEIDRERINEYGKIVGGFDGWQPTLMVSDPEILREVFIKQAEKFADRRHVAMQGKFAHSINMTHGMDKWKRHRTQMSKYFTSGTMKKSMKCLNKILDNLITALDEKCEANEMVQIQKILDMYTMDAICNTSYGIETNSFQPKGSDLAKEMRELLNDITKLKLTMAIPLLFPTLGKILEKMNMTFFDISWLYKFTKDLINQRRNSKEESADFIHTLLVNSDSEEKGMSDDEIFANAIQFLLAGFDTTSSSLAFLIHNLIVNPECQEKLYAEIQEHIGDKVPDYESIQKLDYLSMCIDESLRMYPIAVRNERQCVEDTVVCDIPIKKGVVVGYPIHYFHWSHDIYPEPEKFKPERFSPENKKDRDPIYYTPFGLGPRHCIGMRLALLEMRLAMVRILQKFCLKRNVKTQVPMVYKKSFLLAPGDGVWLSLERRQ